LLETLQGERFRILRRIAATLPAGDRYEIEHDILALAILDWRRRFDAAAERERDAQTRAAEQASEQRRRRRRRGFIIASAAVAAIALLIWAIWTYQHYQRRTELVQFLVRPQEPVDGYHNSAWKLLAESKYLQAMSSADQCLAIAGGRADQEQVQLTERRESMPAVGAVSVKDAAKILSWRYLNLAGGCYLVKGDAAARLGLRAEARMAWLAAAKYSYARVWNDAGFYWSSSKAALGRLSAPENQ
jgi:hypothetical protein